MDARIFHKQVNVASFFIVFRYTQSRELDSAPLALDRNAMDLPSPSTPCLKVCAVSGESGLCIGCGRTLREIAAWGSLSELERLAIMAALPARMANADRAR